MTCATSRCLPLCHTSFYCTSWRRRSHHACGHWFVVAFVVLKTELSRNERRLYACRFWDLHRNATGTQFSRGAIDQWPTSCANSSMDDSIMWYMICVSPCYHFPERAGGWARECRPWGLSSSIGNECLLQQVSVQQIQRVQNMRRVLTIGTVVHKVLAKYFTSKHSTKPVAKPWLPSPQLYSKSEGVVTMFVPQAQTWHSWHLWYSQLKRNIWCGS